MPDDVLDTLATRSFTLDGEPLEIVRFACDNELLEAELVEIAGLEVGEELLLGGGAAATFTLRRTA